MERREFLKFTFGLAVSAGAAAAAISRIEAAPLMVPPSPSGNAPEPALATEEDLERATPQDAQFIVVRRRRRPVYFVRRRRPVYLVRRRRRRVYFY